MDKFIYNHFGLLIDVEKTVDFIVVKNNRNQTRKMSRSMYKENAEFVYEKAKALIGKNVLLRTSQNTNNWRTDTWFSEISESNDDKNKS